MPEEIDYLRNTVEEVFSLVPTAEAIAASREVVENYLRNDADLASNIKWAEFEFSGRFLRGGISNVGAKSAQIISSPVDDKELSELIDLAEVTGLKVGQFLPSADKKVFYWCVPFTSPNNHDVSVTLIRVILITETIFLEILELFNSESNLTKSEKHVVFQLMTGLNPTAAATEDNVSVETKRSQLKKASAKLYCAGQTDIVRMIMGQMIHVLYLCEAETSQTQIAEKFTFEFFSQITRLSVQRLSNGRTVRYWEIGPPDGNPLLMLHGYLFPFILLNARKHLETQNIRLIVPIRPGYLDGQISSELYHSGNLIEQTIEDFALFIKQVWHSPIPVLCHATGGFFAMLIAEKHPLMFERIIVLSINLLPNKMASGSFAASFFGGIKKLANDTGIYETLVRQFQKTTFSNERATKFVLRRLFSGCTSDIDVLNGDLGSGQCFSWYRQLHANSVMGISSDFQLLSRSQKSILKAVPDGIQVTFLHGPNDTFSNPDTIREFISSCSKAELHILPDGGHLASASHPTMLWNSIRKYLDS